MDFLQTPARRKFLFAALYLSEGAPIGFIWWALPTRLRAADVPIEEITWLTSMLVIPWTLKFVWAPAIDVFRSRFWSHRGWIVTAQLVMGATLVPLLWLDFQADFATITILLLAHAIAAATQDVAIDAWCISVIRPEERGRYNGWMQTGMLLGRAVMGGGALILAARIGMPAVIVLLIALTTHSTVLVMMSHPAPFDDLEVTTMWDRSQNIARAVVVALSRRRTWIGILLAVTAGAAYQAVGAIAGPFLIDHQFSEEQVGWVLAIPVVLGMIAGALIGGYWSDHIGRQKSVLIAQVTVVVPILALAAVDASSQPNSLLLTALVTATYFGTGVMTAVLYSLFMDLTDPAIAATQFSAFMGGINACEAWSTRVVGMLIPAYGYSIALSVMCLLAVLPLFFLRGLSAELGNSKSAE